MPTFYEIPLTPQSQTFAISLLGTSYNMNILWMDAPLGGWFMDLFDVNNNPIRCGIPLQPGNNMMEQFQYAGIGGGFTVTTDGDIWATPTYSGLGISTHLWFVTS
jgi:hypothetical protein